MKTKQFHLFDLTDIELNERIQSLENRIPKTRTVIWKCRLEASLWSAKRVRKARRLGIHYVQLPFEDPGE